MAKAASTSRVSESLLMGNSFDIERDERFVTRLLPKTASKSREHKELFKLSLGGPPFFFKVSVLLRVSDRRGLLLFSLRDGGCRGAIWGFCFDTAVVALRPDKRLNEGLR